MPISTADRARGVPTVGARPSGVAEISRSAGRN